MYFWGEPDTTVHFCENKYNVFSWVAEYDNTFSAIPYILLGLGFRKSKIKNIGNALILLGISTMMMHGTLRFYGQWMDECSLFYLSFESIRHLKKNVSYIYFLSLITLYFYFRDNYLYFLSTFISLQLIIVYLVIQLKKSLLQKICISLYIATFILATVFWILDQKICNAENYFPYHALWHFLTALAMFYGFTSFVI